MPTRLSIGLIVAFWLVTTGYTVQRDLLPRLWSDAPPAIRIDLSDEATQAVPARWTVIRNDVPIGTLNTRMSYDPDEDSFAFESTYRNVQLVVQGLHCEIPELILTIRVGRQGDLRAQRMVGQLIGKLMAGPVEAFRAEAKVRVEGTVQNGMLVGICHVDSPLGEIHQPLEPTPVRKGQLLNPLQPVNRLRDVRPGRRWVVYESNPLGEAVLAMGQGLLKKHAGSALMNFPKQDHERPQWIAEVASQPEVLSRRANRDVSCWVIDYRGDSGTARTWVSVEDGRVLRQEARSQGEVIRLDRED